MRIPTQPLRREPTAGPRPAATTADEPWSSAERRWYAGAMALALLVMAAGLVFPDLMGGDAAQDAVMALRMYLADDWVNLVKNGRDYLDKPHLLFWSARASYELFGVHDWAYRLPSALASLLGAWAAYGMARRLHGETAGRLAALMVVTAYAIVLGNHDVRMDALLMGFTAFGTWQLLEYLETGRARAAVLGGAGVALGVSAKGMVAVAVSGCVLFFYVWGRGRWRRLWSWKIALGIAVFVLALSPVLFAYYQQYDLHPDKVVNGRTGVSGVKFILLGQSLERFGGGRGHKIADDHLFFFHTLAWAFLPWSLLTYAAWAERFRELFRRRWAAFREREQLTFLGPFAFLAVLGFSQFKLPHYLNVVLPFLAVFTASYLADLRREGRLRALARLRWVQLVVIAALLALVVVLNAWAFPVERAWIVLAALALLAVLVASLRVREPLARVWAPSAVAILLAELLANTSFYPRLGRYQPGRDLAAAAEASGVDWERTFFLETVYQPFQFYAGRVIPQLDFAGLHREVAAGRELFLAVSAEEERRLRDEGIPHEVLATSPSCRVLNLTGKFVNPRTRDGTCKTVFLVAAGASAPDHRRVEPGRTGDRP
ncbi:glycosyltransferase family 39 protein [Anaeromyxobacter sp. Fw109-5]|uniref:glycosyltransferase family 39 protein n=1 Tax=Anaeromyxobacter sp. (strain Fw109-5) TaxID=404589 RepID=UPI0000ED6DB3|nr:glycosyltransferase family 39 protein [Anaeromyxobacter sp. Fw109-5]ABS28377.1 glycosyl transferase family 39 [Anaeromyxobacter sp. Fw109-5]